MDDKFREHQAASEEIKALEGYIPPTRRETRLLMLNLVKIYETVNNLQNI